MGEKLTDIVGEVKNVTLGDSGYTMVVHMDEVLRGDSNWHYLVGIRLAESIDHYFQLLEHVRYSVELSNHESEVLTRRGGHCRQVVMI